MKQKSVIPKIKEETRMVKMTFELRKDLKENEVICEHCHGTGLEIADNVYGIHGDTTHAGIRFPYKHQSLTSCSHCFNGVLRKCPGCGSLMDRRAYECGCGYQEKKRRVEREKKDIETWEKAEKIPRKEAFEKFNCLYMDNLDRYIFDEDDLEIAIEDCEECEIDLSKLRIYGTREAKISLDADSIAESACDELHEDAYEYCDIKGLQEILDKWCKEQTDTATYYPDYKIGVRMEDKQI